MKRQISHRREVRPRGDSPDGAGSSGVFPAVRTTLLAVMGEGARLDKTIEQALRARRREWSEEEVGTFVRMTTEAVRAWRWRWHCAGLPVDAPVSEENVRKVLRDVEAAPKGAPPAVRASFPDWLWERASAEIGEGWPALAAELAVTAPLFLRVNTLKTDVKKLASRLASERIATVPGPAGSLRVSGKREVFATLAFHEGLFEVQDAGSQLIAPLLGAEPGMRVVDACAGAGGKALHLAALMRNKGRILALDIHEWKLAELRRRVKRAGVDNVEARLVADAPRKLSADRVLLDVPCSGLGVLRRHPDRKWHLRAEELERLVAIQAELLRAFAPVVRVGGKLLYATCSILPSENERQVRAFMAAHAGWRLESERVLRPSETAGDAFYAALLVREK